MHPIYFKDVLNKILIIQSKLVRHFSDKKIYYRALLLWVIIPNFISGSFYLYSELESDGKIIRYNRFYLFYSDGEYEFYPFSITSDIYKSVQQLPHENNRFNFRHLYIDEIVYDTDFPNYFSLYYDDLTQYSYAFFCDTQYLNPIVEFIKEKCPDNSSDLDIANTLLSFVQDKSEIFSMKYLNEDGDYAKFPIETLVEGGGDCEDLSILYSSLSSAMGYETILLYFDAHVYCAISFDEYLDKDTKIDNYLNFTSDLTQDKKFSEILAHNDSRIYNYVHINSSSYIIDSFRVKQVYFEEFPNQTIFELPPMIFDYGDSEISNPKFVLNGKIFYPVECTKYGWPVGYPVIDWYFSALITWGVF